MFASGTANQVRGERSGWTTSVCPLLRWLIGSAKGGEGGDGEYEHAPLEDRKDLVLQARHMNQSVPQDRAAANRIAEVNRRILSDSGCLFSIAAIGLESGS